MSETNDLGPRSISPLAILFRALAGLGGGVIGTGLIVVILFLGSGVLTSALGVDGGTEIHPLFVFVFMAMMFIGSCAANVLGTLLIALTDKDHYKNTSTSIYQVFIANVVILIAMAPIYMIVSGLNVALLPAVAALQVVVSAFASSLILEIIANYRYALLGVYSTAFAVLVSTGVFFLFYSVSSEQPINLLFIALPVMWLSIGIFSGLFSFFYGLVYKLYGVDFLSTVVKYGADDEWVSDAEKEAIEKEQDASYGNAQGASFLERSEEAPTEPSTEPPVETPEA